MDMKQIKELMAAMEKAGLRKVRIKEEKGFEIELEKETTPSPPSRHEPHHHEPAHHFASTPSHKPLHEEPSKEIREGNYVTSPMVGTFYSAPSPDDPLFAKVGDEVDEDTVVCIIEAMKVMNEVKAGIKGKIAEIIVSNADPVEFGSKLFRIDIK